MKPLGLRRFHSPASLPGLVGSDNTIFPVAFVRQVVNIHFMPTANRIRRLAFRVTPEELAAIKRAARIERKRLSEFARDAIVVSAGFVVELDRQRRPK